MAVPTLNAEEFQLDDTGVKLNASAALPFVDITNIQGLDSSGARLQVTTREGVDGSWVDASYEIERTVILEGNIYASVTALETYLDSLKANWAVSKTDKPLYFGIDGGVVRQVFGKPQGLRYNKGTLRRLGCVEAQFTIICADPAIYASTQLSGSVSSTITNAGNRPSPPVFTTTGNATITLGGKTMTYVGAAAIIDVRNRTVTAGSTNTRSGLTFSAGATWEDFMLKPGGNAFSGSGATVSGRSAWR